MTALRDQLLILGRLQELDARIDRLREEERRLPAIIEKTRAKIADAQARLEERRAYVKAYGEERRRKERELEEIEARVSADKAKQMNVKTNQEYHAIMKEIAQFEKMRDERSDDVLLILEKIETADQEAKKAQAHYDATMKTIDEEIAIYKARVEELTPDIERLAAERAALASDIDPILLRRYEGLRRQKAGIAIVAADGGVCGGCHMSVSPHLINKLQRNEDLIFCSNCQRILYWQGEARVNRPSATT
ncbi:hypothetical protein K8I61_00175 [bacterium]|nr:hypothetical protein [bacterium]